MDTTRIILYVGVFVGGFILVSLWSFFLAVRPPRITTAQTPQRFNLPAEEITLHAPDGTRISGWFIPSPAASDTAVMLLHGYPAEKSDMLPFARDLWPDFSILLVDLRYFGKSGGTFTTLGVKERDDIRAAVNFLESRGVSKIGVLGFSLGGAVGILAASDDPRIKAVVSYAAFANLELLAEETYRSLLILKRPLVTLMFLWAQLFFGESLAAYAPENAARPLTIPVFLIHTKKDEQISFRHAERLQQALEKTLAQNFIFPMRVSTVKCRQTLLIA